LKWRKSFLALLELLGIEKVVFGLTRMAWKSKSRFWPDRKCLGWRKLVLAGLEKLEMEEVGFDLTGMALNVSS
jgi:hypothetical protein